MASTAAAVADDDVQAEQPLDLSTPTNNHQPSPIIIASNPTAAAALITDDPSTSIEMADDLPLVIDDQSDDSGSQMAASSTLDIDAVIRRLLEPPDRRERRPLEQSTLLQVTQYANDLLMRQPMLLELCAPMTIVGDIHGQFHDLLQMFASVGVPPRANYLFLGDYVDRGMHSIETITLLLAFKLRYPENFFLLRGNHESAAITRVYGFFDECKRRYSVKLWRSFVDVFKRLPAAALIDERIFCCHGGLSPQLSSLDQIRSIQRPLETPENGLLCDLLWSDPDSSIREWTANSRGISHQFGFDALQRFLTTFDIQLLCRAHQVVEDGYEFFGNRQLVTIFTAPNYCGMFDNAGAVMHVSEDLQCSFSLLKPQPQCFIVPTDESPEARCSQWRSEEQHAARNAEGIYTQRMPEDEAEDDDDVLVVEDEGADMDDVVIDDTLL